MGDPTVGHFPLGVTPSVPAKVPAAKMLAERPPAPIVLLGKLTYMAAESGEAIDDVLAGNDRVDEVFQ
jgi:hypothetical protein